jgi:hypothetical protein
MSWENASQKGLMSKLQDFKNEKMLRRYLKNVPLKLMTYEQRETVMDMWAKGLVGMKEEDKEECIKIVKFKLQPPEKRKFEDMVAKYEAEKDAEEGEGSADAGETSTEQTA